MPPVYTFCQLKLGYRPAKRSAPRRPLRPEAPNQAYRASATALPEILGPMLNPPRPSYFDLKK